MRTGSSDMAMRRSVGATTAVSAHLTPEPIAPVRREVMRMWWENLTFLHWPYEPAEVARLLPVGLAPDVWEGVCWVGLVPFRMRVGLPGGVVIPRLGVFPETNVRTYVVGPDGTPGVWFCSLEAGGLTASATARVTYGLPYYWADMEIVDDGAVRTYRSTRRWPGPQGVGHHSSVRIDDPIAADDVLDFEHYLTARWGLYSVWRDRLLYAPVSHRRWALHYAEVLELDDELMTAAGLPAPMGDPVAHWTPGTEVRTGRPRGVQR